MILLSVNSINSKCYLSRFLVGDSLENRSQVWNDQKSLTTTGLYIKGEKKDFNHGKKK